MADLSPVGSNHVGGCGEAGSSTELGYDLTAGVNTLSAAGILTIGQNAVHILHVLTGLLQGPAAVGIQVDAGIREGLLQGLDDLHLLVAGQNAALQLEILEAILVIGSLCHGHNVLGIQCLLMAQSVPRAVGIRLCIIGKVCLVSVAHEEEVAQYVDLVSLLAVAQKLANRHLQELSQKVEAGGLNGSEHMYTGTEIEGLVSSHVLLALGIHILLDLQQGLLVLRHLGTLNERNDLLQGCGDLGAARHLTHTGSAGIIVKDHDVSGEIAGMCA